MPRGKSVRKWLRRIAFGVDLPYQVAHGISDPQSETVVWLDGLEAPRDVTGSQFMVAGSPFTIGLAVDEEIARGLKLVRALSLRIEERGGRQEVLGTIRLRFQSMMQVGKRQLCLCTARSSRNFCVSPAQLWRRYAGYALDRWRHPYTAFRISTRDVHAMIVFYLCPRPVGLVSITADENRGSIFPMNLMGPIGDGHFAFGLASTKASADLVRTSRRIAISSIPVERHALAYALAKNHHERHVAWEELPFATFRSPTMGIPVPEFALRVREMEVESSQDVGSHTLFVARMVSDERRSDGLQFSVVHGLYQPWQEHASRSNPLERPAIRPSIAGNS